MVELTGIEPVASSLRMSRAPSVRNAHSASEILSWSVRGPRNPAPVFASKQKPARRLARKAAIAPKRPATAAGCCTRAADTSPRDKAGKWPETVHESRSALDEASAFLLDVLAMRPRPSKELQVEARANGIAWATLRRAMPTVGVKKQKVGFSGPLGALS